MDSTSTLSLSIHPKIAFSTYSRKHSPLNETSHTPCSGFPFIWRRRCTTRLKTLVPRAAASRSVGGSSRAAGNRRVYKQSQSENPLSRVPAKELVSLVVPAGVFVAATFVLWKLVEKLLVPKPKMSSSEENKSSIPGMKWFIAPGTNLLSGNNIKSVRESRQKLNEFAKELRSFRSVDLSGRKFGDEGLFFLAESLGYNQSAEEVDFSANEITAAGLEAFDGVLQSNIVLKTLNLSGNPIGDDGAKVSPSPLLEY